MSAQLSYYPGARELRLTIPSTAPVGKYSLCAEIIVQVADDPLPDHPVYIFDTEYRTEGSYSINTEWWTRGIKSQTTNSVILVAHFSVEIYKPQRYNIVRAIQNLLSPNSSVTERTLNIDIQKWCNSYSAIKMWMKDQYTYTLFIGPNAKVYHDKLLARLNL